ncbi:MAG: PKD domain-containing protein, partial [Bacteroidota bacterium]
MKGITSYLYLFMLLLLGQNQVWATHIVGGELTYTCLGNNQFEITLTVFRDCFNGVPYFDNPASIGIFDSDNQLVTNLGDPQSSVGGELIVSLMNDDTLNPVLTNPCLVVPPNVCVHTTTYRDTVMLPSREGGYQLSYQRCCRNATIQNIIGPLDSGATYGVTITEKALNECNSSAKFNDWPPLYICVNEPIIFDQSAVDIDGDSIVYKMCTPLLGASYSAPNPQPPNNPPYDPINWIDPPYSVNNMLNGLPGGAPLQIDINTGLLTGLPNTPGQFVVGICIEEYRDDELISTTRRDFQYNVGICGETVSSFFSPEVVCEEELTVFFQNESENADQFEWYFNDPGNPGFVSNEMDPSYTFSDTGTYIIMLIAEPSNQCVDTFMQEINIQFPSLTAAFDLDLTDCSDSLTIVVSDLSTDSISTPVAWNWTLSQDFTVIGISDQQNPSFTVVNSGIYILELEVVAANGCVRSIQEAFNANVIDEVIEADEVTICPDDSVPLNPIFSFAYAYQWFPEEGLDDPNSPNPIASPDTTTIYTVLISDPDGNCQLEQSIAVIVPERIQLDVPADTTICSTNFLLSATSDQATEYLWASDPDFDQTLGDSATIEVTPIGMSTYYLLARDSIGCVAFDSVSILGRGINVATQDIALLCQGDSLEIAVNNLDMDDQLTYQWSPSNLILSGQNTANPTVQPLIPGEYTFEVALSNQYGCTSTDSVIVVVLDTMPQGDFVSFQQCGGFTVNFTNTSINANFYQWNFGDPTFPDSVQIAINPTYTYPAPGTYEIWLTFIADLPCSDTLFQTVEVTEPQIIPAFDWSVELCSDSVVIDFTDLSTNDQSIFQSWDWDFGNGQSSMSQNPTVVFNESGDWPVVLTITSDDGCVDSVLQIVSVNLIEVNLVDTISFCDMPVALNPDFNPTYTYVWSPADGLDDPLVGNPLAMPSSSTTYSVTVSDLAEDSCQIVRSIHVLVPPGLDLVVSDDQISCGEAIELNASSQNASSFVWSLNPDFSDPIGNSPDLSVSPDEEGLYFIQVEDDFGCTLEDEVLVQNEAVNVASVDLSLCQGDTAELRVININADQTLAYTWTPSNEILSGANTPNPLVSPTQTTAYNVALENQFGCTGNAQINVDVLTSVSVLTIEADPDTIFAGQTSQLEATQNATYTYRWEADTTLSALNISNPIASPTEN